MRYAKLLPMIVGVGMLAVIASVHAQIQPTPPPAPGNTPSATPMPQAPKLPTAFPPPPPTSAPTAGATPPAPPSRPVGSPPPPATTGGPATSMPTEPPPGPPPTPAGGAPTSSDVSATNASGEEMVRLNVQDADIRDIIKQMSLATGRNFILDDNVKGKITIISPKPVTKDEAYQTFLSALAVTGFTTVKGPAGVMKVVKLKDSIQYPIPTHVDSTPYTDSFVTRLIQLSNIGSVDMMSAIKGLVSKDGNIYAYPATNTLIITDSGANIDRLMKIIKELDQEGPQQAMEIIPVHNALARDVAQTLTTLFKQDKQKPSAPAKPGELEDLDEVSNVMPDERTNSIIVLATKRAIEKVKTIVARLDAKVSSGQEGRVHVYYLKYAKAKQMSDTLASLTSGTGQKSTATPAAGGAPKVAEFEGGIRVTADETTNALIITASAKDFQTLIDRVVSKLDVPRRQVYIEAVIMELEINKTKNYGVAADGGGGKSAIGLGQTFGAATALGGALAGAAGGLPGAGGLLGGLISSQTVNINVVGADGTSKSVAVPAFSAFLTALQTYGDTNIVSTPNILTVDNEEALIEVKQDQPIPSATPASATSATLTQSYTFKEAGLTLKITPQISAGNTVLLKVDEELSNFGAPVNFGNNQLIPTSKKRHIKTATVVSDGQTVVLGGLMGDQISNTQSKIPILGDIPLFGFFFRQTGKQVNKNNLLIFLTPHIMNDATDFARILQNKIDQRNKFVEQNYGRKQRELIKATIRNHREDLLEFKAATDMLPDTTFKATASTPADPFPAVSSAPSESAAPKVNRMSAPVKQPKVVAPVTPSSPPGVITVPSLNPGASASAYTPTMPSSSPKSVPQDLRPSAPIASQPPPAATPVPQAAPVKELNLTY